jgi:hypothetical protein
MIRLSGVRNLPTVITGIFESRPCQMLVGYMHHGAMLLADTPLTLLLPLSVIEAALKR